MSEHSDTKFSPHRELVKIPARDESFDELGRNEASSNVLSLWPVVDEKPEHFCKSITMCIIKGNLQK